MRRGPASSPAKLTRPRLHSTVVRERLFRRLDQGRERACIWVCGPPGAGKTTLVASYVHACSVPAIWYQVDSGDSDPATFFYYLRQAVAVCSPRGAKRLPLFTPEYRDDLPGFARRFIRNVYGLLPAHVSLILDNYHELAPASMLHAAVAACLEEVPPGRNLIAISRADPPGAFARAVINGLISRVDWEDLRLTRSETTAIVGARGVDAEDAVAALHEQSSGWVAGVVLMAERLMQTGDVQRVSRSDSLETLFDYFAGQILETVADEVRDALIRTGLLPRVTAAAAEAVTGTALAIGYVEQLHRRRLFTDLVKGPPVSYRYHALFGAFLRARARAVLSEPNRVKLLEQAAKEFEREGDAESAFSLFCDGKQWTQAERLFVQQAAILIAQGRWRTLWEWHATLTDGRAALDPWIGFWLGRAMTAVDPRAARRSLEATFAAFVERDDERGQLLCGVGVLEALYYQYDEFRIMDPWIQRTASHLERQRQSESAEEELWISSVFVVACAVRSPAHPMLQRRVSMVEELLQLQLDVNLKVTAASMLHFFAHTGMDSQATGVATRAARPLLGCHQLTAQRAALYLGEEGYSHYKYGRFSQALTCYDEADAIAKQSGLPEVEARLASWRGFCERRAGLLEATRATIRRLQELPSGRNGIRASLLETLRAYLAFEEGDFEHALDLAVPAQRIAEEAGQWSTVILMYIINASMLIAAGRYAPAQALLDRAEDQIKDTVLAHQRGAIVLMRAWLALHQGDDRECERYVKDVLVASREEREGACIRWYPKVLADVLMFALDRGIDPDCARRLIRERSLVPNCLTSDGSLWHVSIRTLGKFELLVECKSPQYSRKTPKRVLLLLKALIAFGGREVAVERLVDAMWPDLDGDAAHKALSALVHRLRVLLKAPEAVRHRNGRISLNQEMVWVDALTLTEAAQTRESWGPVLVTDLYGGEFLPGEDDAQWTGPVRQKLRDRFIEAVQARASSMEQSGRYQDAARCYEGAIETDEFVESFYHRLMRCYERLDRHTEVVALRRRLQRMAALPAVVARPSPSKLPLQHGRRPG